MISEPKVLNHDDDELLEKSTSLNDFIPNRHLRHDDIAKFKEVISNSLEQLNSVTGKTPELQALADSLHAFNEFIKLKRTTEYHQPNSPEDYVAITACNKAIIDAILSIKRTERQNIKTQAHVFWQILREIANAFGILGQEMNYLQNGLTAEIAVQKVLQERGENLLGKDFERADFSSASEDALQKHDIDVTFKNGDRKYYQIKMNHLDRPRGNFEERDLTKDISPGIVIISLREIDEIRINYFRTEQFFDPDTGQPTADFYDKVNSAFFMQAYEKQHKRS